MAIAPRSWWAKLKKRRPTLSLVISRKNIPRYVARGLNTLWESLLSQLPLGILALAGWFFWGFLGPSSIWFWLALVDVIVVVASFKSKYYLTSALAFAALFALIPIISLSASYYIASDQYRLRYRTVDGIGYLEFPGQIATLKSIAHFRSTDQVVEVIDICGEPKVAKLPLLSYKPIYPQKDTVDAPFAFRKFPYLQFRDSN